MKIAIGVFSTNENDIKIIQRHVNNYRTSRQVDGETGYFSVFKEMFKGDVGTKDIYIIDLRYLDPDVKFQMTSFVNALVKKRAIRVIYLLDENSSFIGRLLKDPYYNWISVRDGEELNTILDNILHIASSKIVTIKTNTGWEKIDIADMTYATIENRSPCYHFIDRSFLYGPCLRTSFEAAISHLLVSPALHFAKPSILINLAKVKSIYTDHIEFHNGTILYVPRGTYKEIKDTWELYRK